MKSSVEPLEGNKVKLSVEVDEAEFDKAIDAAFRKIANEVRIPGFRPGKAPRRILEARIGVAPAREQALQDAIPEYLAKAVAEHDVDIIDTPDVDITAGREEGPVAFDATIEVRPQIIVPGYAGLRVELPSVHVPDEELDEALQVTLRPYGELADADRPAQRGDYLTLDLAAERDGEPVPGLNTEDWSYELGRGWIAEDFDDHLVGAEAGAELGFTAVPSGTEDPAVFEVAVKRVQTLVLPELTDEWVAENLGEEGGVEALRNALRANLESRRLLTARQLFLERTTQALAGLVDEEPPEVLVNNDVQHRAQHFIEDLARRGIPFETYLQVTGQDQQQVADQLREASVNAVKTDLALRAVADAEALSVDDDDLEAEFERMAEGSKQKPAQIRRAYERAGALPDLKADLRKRKALDWLLHNVEVVDPEGHPIERSVLLPDEEELAHGHAHEHHHEHAPDHEDEAAGASEEIDA